MINISMNFETPQEIIELFAAAKKLEKCEKALRELDKKLREEIKCKSMPEQYKAGLQEARDYLNHLLNKEDINLYEKEI